MEYTQSEQAVISAGMITRMAKNLKPSDLKVFCQQLRDLRQFVHEFEYEMDNVLRIQNEDAAEAKVKKMHALGIEFKSICVDDTWFHIDDNGEVKKRDASDISF